MLARLVTNATAESIELGRVTIEVHTASFRAVRGYTVVGAVLDEVAFWRSDDSANPDREIVTALRPAMATVPGALLVGISSPYARRGVLWEAYRRHYGRDGTVLVWQAPTRAMNPTVPEAVIAQAYVDDEASAASEYGAEFRRDFLGPQARRVAFPDLEAGIVHDYETRKRNRSTPRLRQSLAHLRGFFGMDKALAITEARMHAYVDARLAAGAKPATINRELAALKRAFRLHPLLRARAPVITLLDESDNVRDGFL